MRLLDASSLFELVIEGDVEAPIGTYTLDLARYELGNIVWKKVNLLKDISYEDGKKIMSVVVKMLNTIKMTGISGCENDVLKLAHSESLSFYDAAYIEAARRMELVLITEDHKLLRVCEKLGHPAASMKDL
jgi:predicted nucleic acid-binding protein